MSNCVMFQIPIVLNDKEFKVQEYCDLCKEAEERINDENAAADGDEHFRNLQMVWWFLSSNSERLDDSQVRITLGAGRSVHTWRDLKGIINLLCTFAKTELPITTQARDESDNFASTFVVSFLLKPIPTNGKI